jgi:Zn-dependent protease with chaperone function/Zn-finger nucleic acid-binding protein
MECPKCHDHLKKVPTKQGVIIDHCLSCKGVWLDEGEIFMFSKKPKWMTEMMKKGLINIHASERTCPRCANVKMQEGGFIVENLQIDQCPTCHGIWFDDGEMKKALDLGDKKFAMAVSQHGEGPSFATLEKSVQASSPQSVARDSATPAARRFDAVKAGLMPLPSLVLRSTLSFVILYAFLAFVILLVGHFLNWSVTMSAMLAIGIIALQYLISPFLLDLMLRWLYNMHWVKLTELPPHLATFIERVCREKKINIPSIGIIEDAPPNAFTYGHVPGNARVVITRGILHYLQPDEVEAVVAHELGHACHWDILVMTLASMVPVVLYYLYRTLMDASKSRGGKKGNGQAAMVALVAYLLYVISEYIVLWLSRTREYWADRFAGEVTKKPNALSSALVKIAYGLVAPQKEQEKTADTKEPAEASTQPRKLEMIRALGIFDANAARGLALTSYSAAKAKGNATENKEQVADAMQWDLWNPWATYYELHSTHPLPAKRINALTDQAATMQQEPFVIFNRQKPESYWDEFLVDIFVHFLPVYPVLLLLYFASSLLRPGVDMPARIWYLYGGIFLVVWGLCYYLKLQFSYRGSEFPRMKISSLLSKIKVSDVRPIPVTLTGKVIGRGVPGYMFSEDMVMEDESGIIFLDYRQPLGIWEFLFALMRTSAFIGKTVTVKGWFRRAPTPFIELKEIETNGQVTTCYVYGLKVLTVVLMLAGALFCLAKAAGLF